LSAHANSASVGFPLLAAAAILFGQQTPPFDSDLVIRSNTNLVQVRVVAEDSKGRPVTDLQRADFQIQDDRKPQPLTLFSADRGVPSAPAGYSVLLLDWLDTPYPRRIQVQQQLIGLLKKYEPRQRVAIYLLGRDPRLLHDFTSDMAELIQAAEHVDLEFGITEEEAPGRFDARYSGRGGSENADAKNLILQNKIFDTLHALEVIADHLTRVPGRKSLVWLSFGFPWTIGGIDFVPRVESALGRLNKADVAVYTVNACGLGCSSDPGPMSELAQRTGGTVFEARNDLDEGMRLAMEDLRIGYTLGFNAPQGAAPGVHQIRVHVNRPGVKLRYRESYELAANGPAR
jgi:VWFA-related protein